MIEDENQFDDPRLKSAVRRACGREPAAPRELRERVAGLFTSSAVAAGATGDAEGATQSTVAPAGRGWFSADRAFWRTFSAAACVVLALGWMGLQIRNEFFPPTQELAQPARTSIPATLVVNLVRAHDHCAKLPDHHLVAGDRPEALHDTLSADEGVKVSTASLGNGWQFKGAGLCDVGNGQRAAHLLYARGDDRVSVFSMPAPSDCGGGKSSYRDVIDKHQVAGFKQETGLYCVIGSSAGGREFTIAELEPVLAKVQESVGAQIGCEAPHTFMTASAARR